MERSECIIYKLSPVCCYCDDLALLPVNSYLVVSTQTASITPDPINMPDIRKRQ